MRDPGLEEILRKIGQEEIVPSPALIQATKRRIRRSSLLPIAVFLSLALQLLGIGGVCLFLLWPGIGWSVKAYVVLGLSVLSVVFSLPVLAVRDQVCVMFEHAGLLAGRRS